MPSIANQDYIIVRPVFSAYLSNDCYAASLLKGHVMRNTIFDVLVGTTKGESDLNRVIRANQFGIFVFLPGGSPNFMEVKLTETEEQFLGLAAIQVACDMTGFRPTLTYGSDDISLAEENSGKYICVDGKLVTIEVDDSDVITALIVSDNEPGEGDEYANIRYDDLQKLIGIQI